MLRVNPENVFIGEYGEWTHIRVQYSSGGLTDYMPIPMAIPTPTASWKQDLMLGVTAGDCIRRRKITTDEHKGGNRRIYHEGREGHEGGGGRET